MAKKPDQLDRTIDFWRDRRTHRFMLSDETVGLLGKEIHRLEKRKRFTLEHAQSLTLAVSLIEAQLKDCLRLTIDTPNAAIDEKSDFLNIKIDIELLQHFRTRRLSLGQFVFANTRISTVARVFSALEFCFSYADLAKAYSEYLEIAQLTNASGFSEMKAALARVYEHRNRFTHELFDDLAQQFGGPLNNIGFINDLRDAFHFLTFVQSLKKEIFLQNLDEDHHTRGETSKKINATRATIDKLTVDVQKLLNSFRAIDMKMPYADSLSDEFSQLNSVCEEYFSSVSSFRAACSSEGTMAVDISLYLYLQECRRYATHLRDAKRGLTNLIRIYHEIEQPLEAEAVEQSGL